MRHPLDGWTILVAEDEYLVALDVARFLEAAGATIVGPAPRVKQSLALVATGERLDAAVLDINLAGEAIYPVAAALIRRKVPIVFATGYDASAIPAAYADITRCEKPIEPSRLVAALQEARARYGA